VDISSRLYCLIARSDSIYLFIYAFICILQGILLIWCKEADGSDVGLEFCQRNGFSSNLLCSSCRELEQFSLQPLIEPCNQCCQQDADASQAKVTRTVLITLLRNHFHISLKVLQLSAENLRL